MVKAKPKTSKKGAKKVSKKPVKKISVKKKPAKLKKKSVFTDGKAIEKAKNKIKKKSSSVKKKAVTAAKKKTAPKKTALKESVKSKKTLVKKPTLKQAIADKKSAETAFSIKKIKAQILKAQKPVAQNEALPVKKQKKYKPNKKVKYSSSELKHFRDIILNERRAILESAKANMEALVDNESGEYKGDNLTYSTHMAEQGTDEMEREKNYLFVQRDEKYLGYLQDALMRIDQGTYGICIDCKDVPKNLCKSCPLIQKERLELVPITQHCIECKNLRG